MDIELELEQKLLLALLADKAAISPFFDEVKRAGQVFDWTRFEQLVKRHRVGALVHANLPQLPSFDMPASLSDRLSQHERANSLHYMLALSTASKITAALNDAGIDCAILKGCGVAALYYSRPGLRAMIDLDLLVDNRNYSDAEAILANIGFERIYPDFGLTHNQRSTFYQLHNAFTFIRRSDGLQIDLHWRKVQNPVLLADMDRNWRSQIEKRDISGIDLPMLRAAPHFVYILAHGAKHGWVRLKWLVDLDKVTRGLSDSEVAEAAEIISANGLENMAAASLMLCHFTLATPVPAILKISHNDNTAQTIAKLQAGMVFAEEPERPHSLKDWRYYRDRMRHSALLHNGKYYRRHALAREFARPEDIADVSLPAPLWWLLAALSPILGVVRAVRRSVFERT